MRIYTLDGKCNLSGARVKEARLRLGLQIGQMAVSRTETGKRLAPDFELPILAEALGVTTDWLLGKE